MILPEILYSTSNKTENNKLGKLVKEGTIVKILPKAYTSNLEQPVNEIIRKHLLQLIWKHYPEAIVSHRSAIEYEPTNDNNFYLTSSQNRKVEWPGVTLRFTKGLQPLEDDYPIHKTLRVSSKERAYLENLSSSRAINGEYKTVEESVLEEKLILILETAGEEGLNKFRDKAREISKKLDMEKEFEKLNNKVGAILSTNPAEKLKSPVAAAQAIGTPYDPHRVRLFQKLVGELNNSVFESRVENAISQEEFNNFAFFESYFSNYIEGTTFEVEEAIDIVYKGKMIENRSGDSHDIKGTFEVCSNKFELKQIANTPIDFLNLLRERHKIIMVGRPDKNPGIFKEKANRAGSTHFVLPRLVNGTLSAGFELLQSINSPLGKAIFTMFIVSEVHPFDDGNGRIARVMMNAELVKASEQRILIPTAYREDYIGALRKLTRQSDVSVFVRMMDKIHSYSKWLNPSTFEDILQQIRLSQALEEPDQGKLTWG